MPNVKHVDIRHQVLNRCFRDPFKEYTIDDLVDECNKAMRRIGKADVSKRTILYDIATLETDYGIRLDENLYRGRKRVYRYYDMSYSLQKFQMDDSDRNKILAAINVLENYFLHKVVIGYLL